MKLKDLLEALIKYKLDGKYHYVGNCGEPETIKKLFSSVDNFDKIDRAAESITKKEFDTYAVIPAPTKDVDINVIRKNYRAVYRAYSNDIIVMYTKPIITFDEKNNTNVKDRESDMHHFFKKE